MTLDNATNPVSMSQVSEFFSPLGKFWKKLQIITTFLNPCIYLEILSIDFSRFLKLLLWDETQVSL